MKNIVAPSHFVAPSFRHGPFDAAARPRAGSRWLGLWSANIPGAHFMADSCPDSSSGGVRRTIGHGMTESHGIQFRMILGVARDLASLIRSALRSRAQLAAGEPLSQEAIGAVP
jgi:hypothetical protein